MTFLEEPDMKKILIPLFVLVLFSAGNSLLADADSERLAAVLAAQPE